MGFNKKNILLISPEPWNHIFVSKHHYATHLAKQGSKVFFLNPPSRQLKISATTYENVFEVDYPGFVAGLRFFPEIFQRWLITRMYNHIQQKANIEFNVVWSFDNSVFYDFEALPKNVLKISHIVDLNQDFQTRKAAGTADFCFCTTTLIKNRLLKFNTNVHKINHGFNFASSEKTPIRLPGKSKVKALYAGNLAMPFIDWVLIQKMVKEFAEIDFIFIGPNKEVLVGSDEQCKAKQSLFVFSNCFFLGKVESKELLSYQTASDILLVAYQEAYHNDQANPHKMMEYLGSGKMIVATYTSEYVDLFEANLIMMCKRNDEFIEVFQKVLDELTNWNSKEQQQMRRAFALENTYEKQLQKIESIIKI